VLCVPFLVFFVFFEVFFFIVLGGVVFILFFGFSFWVGHDLWVVLFLYFD